MGQTPGGRQFTATGQAIIIRQSRPRARMQADDRPSRHRTGGPSKRPRWRTRASGGTIVA